MLATIGGRFKYLRDKKRLTQTEVEENSDPPLLSHLPEYLHSFVYNPESSSYIAEAYLMFMKNKVRKDVQVKYDEGQQEIDHEEMAEQ